MANRRRKITGEQFALLVSKGSATLVNGQRQKATEISVNGRLIISEYHVVSPLFIQSTYGEAGVVIIDCVFDNAITFKECQDQVSIELLKCELGSLWGKFCRERVFLRIVECIIDAVYLEGLSIDELSFHYGTINRLSIGDITEGYIYFFGVSCKEFLLQKIGLNTVTSIVGRRGGDTVLQRLHVQGRIGPLKIRDLRMMRCRFTDVVIPRKCDVTYLRCSIFKMYVDGLTNHGTFQFSKVNMGDSSEGVSTPPRRRGQPINVERNNGALGQHPFRMNRLSIKDSQLGQFRILESTLPSMFVLIARTDLTSIYYENVVFPKDLIGARTILSSENWLAVNNSLGQLQVVATRLGYKADANRFRALALHACKNAIQYNKGFWNSDHLILWISEKISFYGQNLKRAFAALFVVSIPLFMLIVATGDSRLEWGFQSGWPRASLCALAERVGAYFQFLIPTHKQNIFGPHVQPLWPSAYYTIDVVSRVLLGYIIFHLIRTTRKFSQ